MTLVSLNSEEIGLDERKKEKGEKRRKKNEKKKKKEGKKTAARVTYVRSLGKLDRISFFANGETEMELCKRASVKNFWRNSHERSMKQMEKR